MLKLKPGLIG